MEATEKQMKKQKEDSEIEKQEKDNIISSVCEQLA